MTKIYKIVNKKTKEIIYIGSTKQSLNQRFTQHLKDSKNIKKQTYLLKNECEIDLITEVSDSQRYIIECQEIIKHKTYNKLNKNLPAETYEAKLVILSKLTKECKELIKNDKELKDFELPDNLFD
jgi:excinuclease UvrABC nuclease subunit